MSKPRKDDDLYDSIEFKEIMQRISVMRGALADRLDSIRSTQEPSLGELKRRTAELLLQMEREQALRRKRPKRRPPESGIPIPAVPPNGPLPKQGGAEAPLEFD